MTNNVEITLTVLAFILLFGYQIHFLVLMRREPLRTSFGLMRKMRLLWVASVRDSGERVLAVQTLRNWTMAASFLASTAILISVGALNIVFRPENIAEIAQSLNFFGSRDQTFWIFKLMVLIVSFFFSFFNFTLAIRYYNHASLMINVEPNKADETGDEQIAKVLHHGANHYSLGMRGYYVSIPLMLWLFGPIWLLLGVLVMVIVLYVLDRTV